MTLTSHKPVVLFVLHLPPPVHGAALMGQYVKESKVVNTAVEGHYINLTTAKDLADIGKGGLAKIGRFAKLLWTIRKEVKRLKPDLVYITPNACGGAFYKDFVVVSLLKALGCRLVAHYHNQGVSTRQNRWFDNHLYRRFFKGLKVILLSERLYPDMQKYVRRENVFICPNGIPEVPREEMRLHHDVPRLLFLSNLIESKGVLVLLDACQLLLQRGCSFACDIVGAETDEIDKTRLEREIAQRGLQGMVTYKGALYGDAKRSAFAQTDLFVFPSYYPEECFPLVLLEAMQQGVPCITSPMGGIADIVEDGVTGLLAEKGNAASFADCLEHLLLSPTLRLQMGEGGYLRYNSLFTLPVFEQRMKEILLKISLGGGKN